MKLNNIGKWKVYALETGFFSLDGGAMMGSVPKVLWKKLIPRFKNRIELACDVCRLMMAKMLF